MAVFLSPVGGVAAQFFDNSGAPLTGGKIYTYVAGTTTPQQTYTSASGSTPHSNPIILDSAGRVSNGGEIWLLDGAQYKFVLKTSTDTLIATYDNITGINSNFVNYTNSQEIQTATAGQTVFTLTTMQYLPGTNSLSVFVDGVNQYGPGAQYAYVETDATTVTFTTGLHVGAEVKFTSSQINSSAATEASQVAYDPPFTASVATNVEAKLAQTVSVKDFGAVGDGVTDDTAAIQAAITAATTAKKLLFAPAGNYLLTGSGLFLPAQFPGLIGEGIFRTVFYYTGSATAITLTSGGSLGVYRDWQVVAGAVGASEATARSVARNGIYWNCYGGQGEISNVKAKFFNGFGQKFEAIWDSNVNNVITESCGNASEYAFSVIDGTDTANHTNFNRVQVEVSYEKAVFFSGLNNVLTGLHSERTAGNGTDYTHVIQSDVSVIDGRIEDTTNVKTLIGVAAGFLKGVKFYSGAVDFSWGSRINAPASIEGCSFGGVVTVKSGNLRHYDFHECNFNNAFVSEYLEKQTRLIDSYVYGGVHLSGTGVKVVLTRTETSNVISSLGGVNTSECNACNLAYMPTTEYAMVESCTISNIHTTPFAQKAVSIDSVFNGTITIENNNVHWESHGCAYAGGVVLGAGSPGWAFGMHDTFVSASAGFSTTPAGGTWSIGARSFNPTPTVGQPKSWVCTVAGTPGTWVSEGNL